LFTSILQSIPSPLAYYQLQEIQAEHTLRIGPGVIMIRVIQSIGLLLALVLAIALSVAPSSAVQFPSDGFGFGPPGMGPGNGGSGERKLKLVKKFDKDGDGRLNAEERKAARAYLASSQGGGFGGFGGGWGGGAPGFGGMGGRSQRVKPGAKPSPADVKSGGNAPLFDPNTLRTFFLQFEDSDWEKEMEDFFHTDVDVPATLIVDGKAYKDVGVHFRGNSSYSMVSTGKKRSMNISLNYAHDDQTLLGYRGINLLNASMDPAFLHNVLFSEIAREYIAAPKANFARVVINGESWGIYVNSQQFNKEFTRDFFKSEGGKRWKVPANLDPPPRGGLQYLGDNPDSYKSAYEIKTKDKPESWKALIALCKTLNQEPAKTLQSALAPMLDIEEVLKYLALDVLSANGDGFWDRQSDYGLYCDEKSKFHLIPTDVNEAFNNEEEDGMGMGGFGGFGGMGGFGGGFSGFGGGRSGGMPDALTQEQRAKINEAAQAEMIALTQNLTEAQKDLVKAAMDKNATEASVKAKIEKVAKIQTEIAMTRFTKGIKAITLTDEQKTGMEASSSTAYQQLFGGGDRGGRGGFGGLDMGGFGAPMMGEGGPFLDQLINTNNPQHLLVYKLLSAPELRTKYLEIVRNIAEKWLDWERLGPIAKRYHDLIADDVKADTKKLYSTEGFESGLKTMESFVKDRRTYLLVRTDPKLR
jgi:spore coat protein CotH